MSHQIRMLQVLRHSVVGTAILAGVLAAASATDAPRSAQGQRDPAVALASAASQMADAANHLLQSLSDEQKQKASFEMKDEERLNWHFIPRARKGLPMKEMQPQQERLAQALLNTGLSQRGFVSAETIMSLEQILRDVEKGSGPTRDPENYFVSIFGTPGGDKTWGWRVEGHHLSLNFTVAGGAGISATPSFFGTNPGEVRDGPRAGLRVLDREEDQGRALVKMLDENQRKTAVISETAPGEIITSNVRKVDAGKLTPAGVSAADLNDAQRQALIRLVQTYAQRSRPEIARQDMQKIRQAGIEQLHFAWAGGTEPKQPHYYRVQGPTFVLEYDNTQNNANHVHTVWRDMTNDFGEDLLAKHYQEGGDEHRQAK